MCSHLYFSHSTFKHLFKRLSQGSVTGSKSTGVLWVIDQWEGNGFCFPSLSDSCLLRWKDSRSFLLREFRSRLVWRQLQTLWTCGGVLQHCKFSTLQHICQYKHLFINIYYCLLVVCLSKFSLWLMIYVFPADEQLYFLHYISSHALPSPPLCQREEPGNPYGVDHDDVCRSVALSLLLCIYHFGLHLSYLFRYMDTCHFDT